MTDNEKLKHKAEVLYNTIRGKQSLTETKEYVDFCSATLEVYKMSLEINDVDLKNLALNSTISTCSNLIEIIKSYSKTIDEIIDILVDIFCDGIKKQ